MPKNETANKIQELFENYYIGLVEFCSRIVHCNETSRDIVQDVFVKLLDGKLRLPVEKPVLKSYLYSMVRNASLNYLRREKLLNNYKQANEGISFSDANILDAIIYGESIQQLHNAIQSLPEACRNICELTYLEENSNQIAAELSNTSINTVKTHKRRAISLLRERIAPVMRPVTSILFFFF
jgi:RNA polymerase sigma-70 factor (family 1)